MALDVEKVDYLTHLARLALSEQEKEDIATGISQLLESFEELKQLKIEDVTLEKTPLDLINVLRPDVVGAGLSTEDALSNAPEQVANMFVVPRMVEAE